jgi:hypothetical protein
MVSQNHLAGSVLLRQLCSKNSFAYGVVLAGALALLISLSYLLRHSGLPFQFGYAKSEVSLGLLAQPAGTIIWIASIIVFVSYPFLTSSGRKLRSIFYVHLCFPATILLWLLRQDLFALFCANLILAYSLMVVYSKKAFRIPRRQSVMIFLSTLFSLIILIETFAFVVTIIHPVGVISLFSSQDVGLLEVARFSLNLFYLGDFATLGLLVLLIMLGFVIGFFRFEEQSIDHHRRRRKLGTAACSVVLWILSMAYAVLPYVYSGRPVGIDAAWYVNQVNDLAGGKSLTGLFISEPRAVYVAILYAIRLVVGETTCALLVGVAILSGLASFANYWLAWKMFHRTDIALLAIAMSSLTPQILVASFSAIFDAWLALVEMVFLFGCVLGVAEQRRVSRLVPALCTSMLLMLTHLWTWAITMLMIATVGLLSWNDRSTWRASFSIVAGSMFPLTFLGLMPGYEMVRNATRFGIGMAFANLQNPSSFVPNLSMVFTNYVGGMYSNWIIAALANMGLLGLVKGNLCKRLLQAWIMVPSVFMFFLGPDVQWRLLFLLPTGLLSPVGLKYAVNFLESRFHPKKAVTSDLFLLYFVKIAFVVAVILLLSNNVLRSMIFVAAST